MILNIYNKKDIIKTYTADAYDLMFGTVEDILELIDIDNLKTTNIDEISIAVIKAVPKSIGVFKNLLKDIFDGLTDEDLKNVKVSDIVSVIIDVIKFTFSQSQVNNQKN